MAVTCASFAYPEVDSDARARVASRLAAAAPTADLFVLTTCLRIEVAAPVPREALLHRLETVLGDHSGVVPRVRSDAEAVTHLFRIAAGLESPVLGEREILTQYRQALTDATDKAQFDGNFAKLLQAGIGAGRKARELLPPRPHDSLGAVAAGLVTGADRVAILGAGDMAMAVLRGLSALPSPPKAVVLARRPEHVKADMAEIWSFGRIEEALLDFPAVISATSATSHLMSKAGLADIVQARTEHLTLVDLSMPPDFEPPEDHRVAHYDIDHLARIAETQPRLVDADAAVADAAAKAFRRFNGHNQVGPLVGRLMADADAVVDAAVERFGSRLSNPDDAAILRQAAHTVARSLMARPVAHLNEAGTDALDIEVIARAFQPRRG